MPTLNEKQKQALRDAGINPDEADLFYEDEGLVSGRTAGDIITTAAKSAVPTAGAIAAGAAATPFLTPIGGLAVGIGTAIGGQALQDKILSHFSMGRKFLNRAEGARSTSPTLSMVGELVPEAVTMKPGQGTLRALRGLSGRELQRATINNTALGAGIAGALEGGSQVLGGEDLNLGRIGLASLAGGTLNNPTALGRRLGLSEMPLPVSMGGEQQGPNLPARQLPAPRGPAGLLPPANESRGLPDPGTVRGDGFEFTPSSARLKKGDGFEFTPSERDPSPSGFDTFDDTITDPGEVQSALPPRVVNDRMEEMAVVPEPDGNVLQKSAEVVDLNKQTVKPEDVDKAMGHGLLERETTLVSNDDLAGMNKWLDENDLSETNLGDDIIPRSADKTLGVGSSAEEIMDKAAEVYHLSNGSLDNFKAKMRMQEGFEETRIPASTLWKTLKQKDLIDPNELGSMFHTGIPMTSEIREKASSLVEGMGNFFSPTVEKIRKNMGRVGEYIAPKIEQTYRDERYFHGKNITPFMGVVNKIKNTNRLKKLKGQGGQFFNSEKLTRVAEYMSDEFDGGIGSSKIQLDDQEKEILLAAREVFKKFREDQNSLGLPIIERIRRGSKWVLQARDGNFDPTWMPMPLKSTVIDNLLGQGKGAGESTLLNKERLKREYISYAREKLSEKNPRMPDKILDQEAEKKWDSLLSSFSAETNVREASRFGPLDIPGGIGVPPSWRDLNLMTMVNRYSRRAGKRLAYWKNIESDPHARVLFGINKRRVNGESNTTSFGKDLWRKNSQGVWEQVDAEDVLRQGSLLKTDDGRVLTLDALDSNRDFASIIDDIEGRDTKANIGLEALMGVVKANRMGFSTGLRDLATMPFISSTFLAPETVARLGMDAAQAIGKKKFEALTDSIDGVRKHISDGMKKGVITHDIGSIDTYLSAGGGDVVESLFRARDVLNKVSLRSQLEQLSRGTNFGLGKYAAVDMGLRLAGKRKVLSGMTRRHMESFFDNFSPKKDWRKAYGIDKGELDIPAEDLEDIAARFVEATQGTYDQRGLPAWAVNKGLSPILSLYRWGIERSLVANKYIVQPALKGNFMPALMTIGSALGGGGMLVALNEVLAGGRKTEAATWKEWYSAEDLEGEQTLDAGEGFFRFTTLMSTASQLGIAMDILDGVVNSSNTLREDTVVQDLLLGFKDDLAKGLTEVMINVMSGSYQGWEDFAEDLDVIAATQNQTYRLISRKVFPKHREKTKELNRKRDTRVFDRLLDYPVSAPVSRSLRTRDHLLEAFKEEEDLPKAAGMVPGLVDRAIERSTEGRTVNPSKLKTELGRLRSSNSVAMPNPRTDPLKAGQYLKFLRQTQGQKNVDDLTRDFRVEDQRTKIKNSLVPSLGL